jgi:hypothetical protein
LQSNPRPCDTNRNPGEQVKNPGDQLINPGEQLKRPGEQLKNLSQGKDVSAEDYYQQALAILNGFNVEDKDYESLDPNVSLSPYGFLDASLEPSPFIQK